MGYTNKTSHYELPQWIAGDKPSWLGDVNTAMLNIDTAIAGAAASASAAESSAAAANAQVQAQEAKITKNTTDIQAMTNSLAETDGEVAAVKATAAGALPKSGGTMTGNLILNAAPTSDLQAATKKYVDDHAPTKTEISAGKNLDFGKVSLAYAGNVLKFVVDSGTVSSTLTDNLTLSNGYFTPLVSCPKNVFGLTTTTPAAVNDITKLVPITKQVTKASEAVVANFGCYWDGTNTNIGLVYATAVADNVKGAEVNVCIIEVI